MTDVRRPIYTAQATVTGGRSGQGRTSDGALDVQLRPPGEDGGTNPEQLFAIGYGACFASAVGVSARRARVDVGEVSIDVRVHLEAGADRSYTIRVELDVELPDLHDADQAAGLVAAAHRVCPYSNATRGNIDVSLTANGRAVELG